MSVDVASGVMSHELTDCWFPGRLPLSFHRYYSTGSLSAAGFTIAPGWRHGFEIGLRQNIDGFVFTDEKGHDHELPDLKDALSRSGRLTVPEVGIELRGAGAIVELERYASAPGTKLVFRRDAGVRQLRAEGVSWYPGVRLDFEYDRVGRLSQVTQTRSGRRLLFDYDQLNRLAEVTLAGSGLLVVRFEHDPRGRLVGVADSVGAKARYEYDGQGRMLSESKRGGGIYTFRYDVEGRCVYASGTERFEERKLAYSAVERTTRVSDSHGQVTRYAYNESGQIVEVETPLGHVSQFAFDAAGRPSSRLEGGIVKSETKYDELGRIASASAPDGRKIELSYDDDHNLTRCTDLDGRPWTYRYLHRRLVGSTNPLGHEWRYESNEFGDLMRVNNPIGAEQRFGWDRSGNLEWAAMPDGAAWWYRYDELGRVVEVRDPAGGLEQRSYDSSGALTAKRGADGRLWRIEYDAAGRPAAWIFPDGARARALYNSCGQLIERVEADGSQRRFEWDTEPGRILAIQDGAGKRLTYEYDAEGRPVTRRSWDGAVTRLEYDALGSLTAVTTPGGGRIEFEYDDFVRIKKRTDPDGQVCEFEYDDAGLVTLAKNASGEVKIERDLYGRVLKETQDGVSVEHEYDALGRPTLTRLPFGPEIETEWSPTNTCSSVAVGGYLISFEYDALYREVARHLPGGGEYRQAYDPCGRVTEQAYRAPGAVAASQNPRAEATDFTRRFEYDPVGRLSRLADSRRGAFQAVHDAVGRLCAVLRDDGSAAFYDFDAAENRVSKAEAPVGAHVRLEDVMVAAPRSGIRFDLGRLEKAGCDVEISLFPAVDPGNRIVERRTPRSRTFFHLDAEGRLVRKEVQHPDAPSRQWKYEWNANDTLASLVTPEGERWVYEYDALNRRTRRRGPTGDTRYVWSGNRLLHILVDGAAPRTRVPHPVWATHVAELRDGDTYYPLADQVRGTAEIVDERGVVVWSSRRGAWGETPSGDAHEGDEGFAGQIYDPESGLYYNLHRYYDPELGRFISPDPIGILGGLNEYAYVPSPLGWLDMEGLTPTGGPFAYLGGSDNNGRPDIRGDSPTSRQVTNPKTGEPNTVPAPGSGDNPDGGGKTLAIVEPAGDPSGRGAFVSGHGGAQQSDFPKGWDTTGGDYGNWCHAEMQALNWMRTAPPGEYNLYIDRPPCEHCDDSLAEALAHLSRYGRDVDVYYKETDEEGNVRWKKYSGC